jgi:catechol 2,3-dioxygenase-like lactoylglutathione lyase family enzyme
MKAITTNLIVESIESCLAFYVDRLGFAKTIEVPHGGALGFVILERDHQRLMLQSRASIAEDVAGLEPAGFRAVLYIEVEALAPIREALRSWPRVVPERTTPYGAREIIVRDPAGNVVFFASREAA